MTVVWIFCALVHVLVSLRTPPPPPENTTPDLTIHWGSLRIFENLGTPWYRNLALWYALGAAGLIGCYVAFSGLFLK